MRRWFFSHVLHMVELALAVPVGIVHAVIDHPAPARLGIDVHAVDQTDAFDQSVRIAAVLQPHQFDLVREVLASTVSSKMTQPCAEGWICPRACSPTNRDVSRSSRR